MANVLDALQTVKTAHKMAIARFAIAGSSLMKERTARPVNISLSAASVFTLGIAALDVKRDLELLLMEAAAQKTANSAMMRESAKNVITASLNLETFVLPRLSLENKLGEPFLRKINCIYI